MTEKYAVVVIGGGAAGLSAALVLGRARHRTLVVDAGEPRNAPAAHMQGFLTRDGMPPAEFLALGREEIARYGVELVRDRVVEVTRGENLAGVQGENLTEAQGENLTAAQGEGFTVLLAGGRTVRARRLVVATGLKDELPAVAGVAERFGRDVLHCPFCHGWEVRDQPFGVLASSPASVHQALMVSQWSKDVRFFLHTVAEEELSDEDLRRLAAAGVEVVAGEVAGLMVEDDRLTGIRLADGTEHARSVLFLAPRALPQTGLLEGLGAELHDTPFGAYPVVDATGLTTVPGVWAAGNAIGFAEQVVHAASGGYRAASAIVGDLLMSDLDAAAQV
ncbi:NAD(P)/FAD-dependent oxidoreductase [Streptomyces sp. WAC04114]|uniref:NAD(P)/FAD-dependent oxidoreductase n=1 Tax=Streptomyces sp. WAC04114 TaxID=2867961 RepID=UPI001C8B86E3|nr:NAD(P)/FAD-dependent oxidoreductase [Streptomyces sp. WAC04114]MBX9365895.1 NAD(P)/FAD-dependent oxidoreductase [Streptomyces sp. WAC04114]